MERLASFRSERSFVGGGAALNRDWLRLSDDIDLFTDVVDLPASALTELAALREAGFSVDIVVQTDTTVEAIVREYGFDTKIQWLDDEETSRRFFAAVPDDEFGFRLHQADNAVNKVLCSARRNRAPRDAVDLVNIIEKYAPLAPLVWAACGKDADLTPIKVIEGIRKNAFGYAEVELRAVRMTGNALTPQQIRDVLTQALDKASAYCEDNAPEDFYGCLFVDNEERPIAATGQDLHDDLARAIKIKQFRATPRFPAAIPPSE